MKSQGIPLILIEPDPGLQELTRLVALRAGFQYVELVGRGDLAQTLLRASPAAVVVTELCLPRLDGVRLLENLEPEGHLLRHRVVVLSVSPRLKGLEPRLKALGVKAVLAKPFETSALVELLTMLRETVALEAELSRPVEVEARADRGTSERFKPRSVWTTPSEASCVG